VPNVWDAMKKHEAEQAQSGGRTTAAEPPADQAEATETGAPVQAEPAGDVVESLPEAGQGASAVAALGARGEAQPPKADYSPLVVAHHERGGHVTEEYRALRTSLLAQSKDETFCYMVTSADQGEGKTVTSTNLAFVMSERLDRVTLLVDCDLRKSRVGSLLKAQRGPGMAELLRGQASFADVIRPTVHPNLFFISAGNARQDEVGELLGRSEVDVVLHELRRRYDYVIFDTPPVNAVSDACMLGRSAGEALMVVRMNKTSRESVDKAVRLLHAANVNVSGIILTHRPRRRRGYYYRYRYYS
jgi:capsular exopolysaccharide synthesis family protein